MKSFVQYNPTPVFFGRGRHHQVGDLVKEHSDSVLLVVEGGIPPLEKVYEEVRQELKARNIRWEELHGVQPNPRLKKAEEGVALCREKGLTMVLAVGGGSVIDTAKAIALGACYDGALWDFFSGKAEPKNALPVGVVLTIPAAGSEGSCGCVITKEEGQLKRDCVSPLEYPVFAILNPELCVTLPPRQIAAGGADMMAHVMERYFSNEPNTDLSDRLCEAVMKSLLLNVPKVVVDREDVDAWAEVMWGGNMAHNGLVGQGRQDDWASHKIGHEISAVYDIPHGFTLALVFPAWMKTVYPHGRKIFLQFAVRVMGVEPVSGNDDDTILEGIARFEEYLRAIGAPVRLSELGIGDDRFQEMAEKCCEHGTVGNLYPVGKAEVVEILRKAL